MSPNERRLAFLLVSVTFAVVGTRVGVFTYRDRVHF